jgi:hypothetical protein
MRGLPNAAPVHHRRSATLSSSELEDNPLRTRGCGCGQHPAFPTPFAFEGEGFNENPGRIAPRDREAVSAHGGMFEI